MFVIREKKTVFNLFLNQLRKWCLSFSRLLEKVGGYAAIALECIEREMK